jgi:hypothetical protein
VCPLVWLAEIGLRRWCSEADRGTTFSCQWEYVTSHEPEIKAGDAGACARTFLPDPFAQPGITASLARNTESGTETAKAARNQHPAARSAFQHVMRTSFSTPMLSGRRLAAAPVWTTTNMSSDP